MLRSQEDTVRVGMWIAIVIAAVAFLVLLLPGNAYPAEPAAVRRLVREKSGRDPATADGGTGSGGSRSARWMPSTESPSTVRP